MFLNKKGVIGTISIDIEQSREMLKLTDIPLEKGVVKRTEKSSN